MRTLGLAVAAAALWTAAAGAQAPQPRLANGRLETHAATTGLAEALPALAATLTEPAWIGYAAPVVDGDHSICDGWNGGERRQPSTAPVHLERPGFFIVMFRIEDAGVARIRSYSADCALDAGGKAVHWLAGVSPADSLAYLRSFVDAPASSARLADSAVSAMALHAGQPALEALIALAREHASTKVRGTALFWLAQRAGQRAVGTISAAIEGDPDTEVKKRAVFALSQLPKDQGVPLLIEQARSNKNPVVRRQAMFWLGQSRDPRALQFFAEILK